jgi:hypothetical protein
MAAYGRDCYEDAPPTVTGLSDSMSNVDVVKINILIPIYAVHVYADMLYSACVYSSVVSANVCIHSIQQM